ncbi:MAG: TonB-dependent siderophore receptor [Gammaproteobacteria bacterium]|nr:TonB-dependent siderophore receptor [Gammaproteobacteria bacterium]MBU1491424.1 TonB-dependent siderophore receptor [Gammaproteobacteria bacterium]MBU2158274.1 TonB-dependent siderophore receptor [Gammaproteobacteria bacterium]MBU2215954.1 TonB-dependent siderophore receptor [Gammaproteobacteria bacterium]MBU2323919.1 TonB-dependent siderophore receptor [Gammaproteobacteria bacterium]
MRSARPLPSTLQPRILPTAICLALSLLAGTASLPLQAAEPASSVAAPSVPAGPLDQALNLFAEQAGITLSYSPQMVHGLRSPGVAGGESLDDGLRLLLGGTGLVAEKTASGYVVRLGQSDASYQLEPMTIKATLAPGAFEPVPGYFASNASSASKSDKPILETAQSISVVTAAQMADRKVNRVEDAVAYTAGVRVGGSGLDPRFDTINVRGFETTQSADFLDGLRQAGSGWLALPSIEAYSLERIEVLKGPASVLYGQISPGGMVNRVSKRPSLLAKNQVEVQAGNYNHRQGQFDIGGKLDEAGDVLVRTVGIYRDAEYSIEQMDNNTRLLAPSLSWQIDPDTSLTLLAQYQERQTAASPMLYRDGDHLTNIWQGDEYFDKLEQRKWSVGYEFEHAINETFSLQQNLRYGQLDTTNQYLDVGVVSVDNILPRSTAGSYEDMSTLSTDTRLISRFATGNLQHTVVSGVDYAWLDTELVYASGTAPSLDLSAPDYHQPISDPDNILVDREGLEHRAGMYLQDQIEIDRWRLSAGLRRDWVHARTNGYVWGEDVNTKISNSATTGSVGALYLYDNGLAPYASYATSFLPQSGSDATGKLFEPSEGEQYEVGLKYQPPGSSTMLTASLYHLTQSNVSTRDPNNASFQVQTGEQVSRGLELEAVSDLTDSLRMNASYSFNDAEVTKDSDFKGKAPKNVPRHLASLWLNYSLPFGFGVSAGARYTGSTYGNGENTVKNEDYTLFDAGVHYDFGSGLDGVRLALNARNLTDKRYINCQDGYCYRGEARSLVTSLSYSW